jgi:hypothetical protein
MGTKSSTLFFSIKMHEYLSALLNLYVHTGGGTNFSRRVLLMKMVLAYLIRVKDWSTNY